MKIFKVTILKDKYETESLSLWFDSAGSKYNFGQLKTQNADLLKEHQMMILEI